MAQQYILEIWHGIWVVILPLDGGVLEVEYTHHHSFNKEILGPGRWTNPGHACVKTNQW
jgi:hypothetical protein